MAPPPMRLSELLEDYLERTRTQIEPSTADSAAYRMRCFIAAIGDVYADQVTYSHCERFQQWCIDNGLSVASANTHIKMLRRIFSLAVKRSQLEKNPFTGVPMLKVPRKMVRLFSQDETYRLLRAATTPVWKARILLAKTAGLRRGEILNLTVSDVDFDKGRIIVQPKRSSSHTWRWPVKDKDRRELPLIDEAARLLTDIHAELPEEHPYLLLSPSRYDYLMDLKAEGLLIDRIAKCPEANFRRDWLMILRRAAISDGTFHDLRATCITEWFEQSMMPHEVQRLAGHASIDTTMRYYVGIRESMIDKAGSASRAAMSDDSWRALVARPEIDPLRKKKAISGNSQVLDTAEVTKIGATGLEPATS